MAEVSSPTTGRKTKFTDVKEIIPLHWVEQTVVANAISQHFYRTGGDKPVVILLHGFSENGLCWFRVARALETDYDVIMLDARGHGLSDGPETGYSQEIVNADVAALITELRLERPALMGHSNGALTAGQVAASYPELVRAVLVEDPPWQENMSRPPVVQGVEPWPGYNAWLSSWKNWHKALKGQSFEERLASSSQFLMPGMLNWDEVELLTHLEAQAQFNLDLLDWMPPVPTASPWGETVGQLKCPLLLMTGNPERRAFVTSELAAEIMDVAAKGKHLNFPEVSHFMHHEMQGEKFDEFVEAVKKFLREVY